MNSPENRELTAEIMFETFDVPVCMSRGTGLLRLLGEARGRAGGRTTEEAAWATGLIMWWACAVPGVAGRAGRA